MAKNRETIKTLAKMVYKGKKYETPQTTKTKHETVLRDNSVYGQVWTRQEEARKKAEEERKRKAAQRKGTMLSGQGSGRDADAVLRRVQGK